MKIKVLKAWILKFDNGYRELLLRKPSAHIVTPYTPGLFLTDSDFDALVERITEMARTWDISPSNPLRTVYKSPAEIAVVLRKEWEAK